MDHGRHEDRSGSEVLLCGRHALLVAADTGVIPTDDLAGAGVGEVNLVVVGAKPLVTRVTLGGLQTSRPLPTSLTVLTALTGFAVSRIGKGILEEWCCELGTNIKLTALTGEGFHANTRVPRGFS